MYKRQALFVCPPHQWGGLRLLSLHVHQSSLHNVVFCLVQIFLLRHIVSSRWSVSYTHLDVYKRQPLYATKAVDPIIINAGDGAHEHPTQALLDMYSILEKKESLEGLKVVIIGDIMHSRVAVSYTHLDVYKRQS